MPVNYPADVVVCPQCRQVVNVKPEDRIMWRPVTVDEFMEKRFPHSHDDADVAPASPSLTASHDGSREPAAGRVLDVAGVAVFVVSVLVVPSLLTLLMLIGCHS